MQPYRSDGEKQDRHKFLTFGGKKKNKVPAGTKHVGPIVFPLVSIKNEIAMVG